MINLLISYLSVAVYLLFISAAGYFTYQETGLATAIIVALLTTIALFQDSLRKKQDFQISMLIRDSERKDKWIAKLEQKIIDTKE